MAVKERKKLAKEYFSKKIQEALEINRKAQELLHKVWGEELTIVREDRDLLKKEEEFLENIKRMEEELKQVAVGEHLLDKAVKAKSTEVIRKMCDDLRLRISTIIRKLETLRSQEHAVEEKKGAEIKGIREELKDTTKVEDLAEQLKDLEKRIISMAEKASIVTKAKIRQIKL
jgi:hypothetical protein